MDLITTVSLLLLLLLGLCNAHRDQSCMNSDFLAFIEISGEDITTTILRMNNGSTDFLVEGDILIPRTRNALKCTNKQYSCRWPKSPTSGTVDVPYVLSDKYDDSEKKTILDAMKGFGTATCVRFIPRTTETAYLSIEPRYGCSSLLGRIGDKQVVSLQRFGCVQHGIIQHELLHALGFYHEHTRSDRDQYVRVNWQNIIKDYFINFDKMDTDNLNTKYDYSSVMHYGRTAFGITPVSETLTPIPNPNVPIGQIVGMSDIDILRVNILYQCQN
ncbi:low choriolytic enzyme-like isoform X2 [Oreochromis niloticus]|uniref:low choriolytic enzyme-like isoform X2 n=1 Tax=Oreochromis niloticus TaxID=8128 RepID=UPI00090466BA|nr:low choriolytic enzyme-like isoform X2 [Oreochromis niloticus]